MPNYDTIYCTFFDVVPVNCDILISVKTGMFMKEADSMHYFVDNCTKIVAPFSN